MTPVKANKPFIIYTQHNALFICAPFFIARSYNLDFEEKLFLKLFNLDIDRPDDVVVVDRIL